MNFDKNTINKLKDMMNSGNLNDVISQIPPEMIQNFSSMINNSQNVSNDTKLDPNIKDNKDSTSNNTNINNFSTNQKPNNSFDFSKIDMNTLIKMQSIMNKMNNSNSASSNLLQSLKPYLRESRKEKVDQYATLLNIAQISGLFSNSNNTADKFNTTENKESPK